MTLMGTVGSQRRTSATICCARRARVLCRLPRASLTFGVVAKTLKNGSAQRRFVQGRVTTKAMVTQRKPGVLTECFLLERKLSRKSPPFADLASPASLQGFIHDDF